MESDLLCERKGTGGIDGRKRVVGEGGMKLPVYCAKWAFDE